MAPISAAQTHSGTSKLAKLPSEVPLAASTPALVVASI